MQYRNHPKGTTITGPDGKLLIDQTFPEIHPGGESEAGLRPTCDSLSNDGSRNNPMPELVPGKASGDAGTALAGGFSSLRCSMLGVRCLVAA
jgi:hypothetical protein